jgi:hypothetical protein
MLQVAHILPITLCSLRVDYLESLPTSFCSCRSCAGVDVCSPKSPSNHFINRHIIILNVNYRSFHEDVSSSICSYHVRHCFFNIRDVSPTTPTPTPTPDAMAYSLFVEDSVSYPFTSSSVATSYRNALYLYLISRITKVFFLIAHVLYF